MNKKQLRKKLALMLANLKKKRRYYTEVEYLESTGTQYIDTGIPLSNENTVKAKIRIISENNSFFYGARKAYMVDAFGLHRNYAPFGSDAGANYVSLSQNTDYIVEQGQNGIFINGELKKTYPVSTFTTPENCYLFYLRQESGFYDSPAFARIYYFQVWDNGVLIRDMIPVLDWNYTPCMYDKVTEQLFYNQGTGSFTYGREIHYVDYLENITSQASLNYIPTTYIPTTNTNLEAKVRYTGGASGATWAIGAATWWGIHYQGQGPKIGITNGSTDPYQVYTPYTAGNDITLKLDGSNVYADGTLIGSLTKQNASSTLSLFRYSTSANLSWVGRIYYLDIWDNNGDVFKFRPAIDENGTPFMFDRVSHTCYLNQGTGAFKYPAIEVEYLQSTGTQYIDTGVYPTQLTEVEYRCAVTGSVSNADSHLFGSRLSASSEAFDLAYMNTPANGLEKFRFIHGTTTTQETTTSVTASQLANPHTYYMSGTSFKVDGSVKMSFTTTSFTGTYSLWLFGVNSAGSLHNQVRAQRVYKCPIWDNGVPVRDFIPCFKDGVLGMWDKVNNVFYQNAGTGSFTTSKIVEPEYE